MAHILLVDDDRITTKLLQVLLTHEGYAVTATHSSHDALVALQHNVFALIILDMMLPDMDGLELCRRIRTTSTTPILFLSARQNVRDIVAGLRIGGDDYLSKPYDGAELLARIESLLRRATASPYLEAPLPPSTDDVILDQRTHTVTVRHSGKTARLTPSEMRLLHCLLSTPGCTVARDTIIGRVWGSAYIGASNELDVYIMRLRSKLEKDPHQPQLLLTVRSVGYKYQPSTRHAPVEATHPA